MAMVLHPGRRLAALVLCCGMIAAASPAAAADALTAPAAKPAAAAKPSKPAVKTKVAAKSAAKKKPAAKKKVAKKEAPALPQTAVALAAWAVQAGDNHDLPFAVIDKTAATVLVYDAKGKLVGSSPALVGSATGDDSMPDVGDRELSDIPMDQRTTPAGRFIGAYGAAAGGEKVLWVDYDTAISMHPVITTNPAEKRPERIKSPTPDDNRITHGCINVPASFYNRVVRKTFAKSAGLFYILPDTKPMSEVFPDFYVYQLIKGLPDRSKPAADQTQATSTPEEQPRPSA